MACLRVLLLACAALLGPAVLPAGAALLESFYFSLDAPKGWECGEEGEIVFCQAPGDAASVSFLVLEYEEGDPELLIRDRASEAPPRKLADGQGYVYERDGERLWAMMTPGGLFCEAGVSAPVAGVVPLLRSMKPLENPKETALVAKALAAQEVLDWLSWKSPAPEGKKPAAVPAPTTEEARREYAGKGFGAEIPQSWVVQREGEETFFVSPDKQSRVSVRIYPGQTGDEEAFSSFARQTAKSLGGKNLRVAEGSVECLLPDGSRGIFDLYGEVVILRRAWGRSDTVTDVLMSVSPAE